MIPMLIFSWSYCFERKANTMGTKKGLALGPTLMWIQWVKGERRHWLRPPWRCVQDRFCIPAGTTSPRHILVPMRDLESGPYPCYLAFPVCILSSIYSPNMYWGTRLGTRVSVIGCLLWGAASFKLQMMKIRNSVGVRTLLEVAGTRFIVPQVEQIGGLSLLLTLWKYI